MSPLALVPEADPLAQFERWFDEAVAAGEPAPEAVTLATATAEGAPSARMVLYRGLVRGALAFYTNYQSRKARELDGNPRAALCFHWKGSGRQVRVEGAVERTTRAESEAYFRGRPRDSQLGAWASPQSAPVPSREALVAGVEEQRVRFDGQEVPCPPAWGGYRLVPSRIELWQDGAFRLHDRFVYTRTDSGWRCERLAP